MDTSFASFPLSPSSRRSAKGRRPWLTAALWGLAGCGGSSPMTTPVPAACTEIHGTQQAAVSQAGCKSPVNLCTLGVITGTGLVDGTSTLDIEQVAAAAGLSAGVSTTTLSYTGKLSISAAAGTLSLQEVGLLDTGFPGGLFISRDVILSGTGSLSGMTGYLFFEGSGTITFNDQVTGSICRPAAATTAEQE